MSPLQILTIKLLELPVQSLEQKIRSEIEENPVLDDGPDPDRPEESKDISIDEIKDDDYIPAYKTHVNNWGKDARPEYNTFSVKESFNQKLMDQLGCRNLDKRQYEIASFLIGSLDNDGYLRRDVESLVDDMAFRAGIETSAPEVLSILKIIQDFEPTGVGARDLRECLLLQLRACKQTKEVVDAENILENYFQEFTNKHFQKILSRTGMTEADLKKAMSRILRLNPSPGGDNDDSYEDVQQIVPDFILDDDNGHLTFSMPRSSVPELRINKKYADMLLDAKGPSDRAQQEAAAFYGDIGP